MFGHQDSTNHDSAAQPANGILSHPIEPQNTAPQSTAPTADTQTSDGDEAYIMTDLPSTPQMTQTEGAGPLAGAPPAPNPAIAAAAPAVVPVTDSTGLLELKQAALHELTPLLDHLEQTAEEKFRTMMMMIQASDDQTMLAEAYAAAQSIEDKKTRAQALLDVVNEINYFTQQHTDSPSQ